MRSDLKKFDSFTLEMSKNHLIRTFLRNGRLRKLTTSLSKPYTNSSVPVTQEYFNNEVLSKSSGIEDYGSIRIRLAACAIFCWFVIYACIFKGAKVMGKVVYLTVIVPYFLLIVMLIRGLTLEGAIIGIEYFLGKNS